MMTMKIPDITFRQGIYNYAYEDADIYVKNIFNTYPSFKKNHSLAYEWIIQNREEIDIVAQQKAKELIGEDTVADVVEMIIDEYIRIFRHHVGFSVNFGL